MVTKGLIFKRLDEDLKKPDPNDLKDLKAGKPLADLGLAKQTLLPPEKTHLVDQWLDQWWPGFQKKEAVLRGGYIQAHEVAQAPLKATPPASPKPIVSYWVTGTNQFEAYVLESEKQVTILLFTPSPPPVVPPAHPAEMEERIWVVAHEQRIDEIRQSFPAGYTVPAKTQPIPTEPAVKSQQLVGY
jgi:hypothetical protein